MRQTTIQRVLSTHRDAEDASRALGRRAKGDPDGVYIVRPVRNRHSGRSKLAVVQVKETET